MNILPIKYNRFLNFSMLMIPLMSILGSGYSHYISIVSYVLTFSLIIFTIFMSFYQDRRKKMYYECIFITMTMGIIIFYFLFFNSGVTLENVLSANLLLIMPLNFIIIGDLRISDSFFLFIAYLLLITELILYGGVNEVYTFALLTSIACLIMYKNNNNFVKIPSLIFVVVTSFLITSNYLILILIIALSIFIFFFKLKYIDYKLVYIMIYVVFITLILLEVFAINLSFCALLCFPIIKSWGHGKASLLFVVDNFSDYDKEKGIINLLNNIDYSKFYVTLLVKGKRENICNHINRNVYIKKYKIYYTKYKFVNLLLNNIKLFFYRIINYNNYTYSCCYGIDSKYANMVARVSSLNSCLYFVDNYICNIREDKKNKEWFDNLCTSGFKTLFFLSNEALNNYLKFFPKDEDKCFVINNFIDIPKIEHTKNIVIDYSKPLKTKLLVYVGELDEDKTHVSMILEVIKEIPKAVLWIIGNGKDKERYVKLIRKYKIDEKVVFIDEISKSCNYISKADYVVLAPDYGMFPIVSLEALALRKEIITTFRFSDDDIDIKKYAHVVSKESYLEDIKEIIKYGKIRSEKINLKTIQYSRSKKLEKIYKGEI